MSAKFHKSAPFLAFSLAVTPMPMLSTKHERWNLLLKAVASKAFERYNNPIAVAPGSAVYAAK